ncbi:MAG TPA: GNAT family N-acetyltransferase [Candidatus Elarobacter sp.]|nr:GNAT family N-acetyltransferase [Candidatus Elarobacter sp.]
MCERFTMEHAGDLARMDRRMDVQRWLFGKTYTAAETHARAERRVAYWETDGMGDYRVRTEDGTVVGFAGFFPSTLANALAIGYALMPEFWGRGYGTELARALTRTTLDLRRGDIVATVLATNSASRHVLEKAGFIAAGPAAGDPEALLYRYERRARPSRRGIS